MTSELLLSYMSSLLRLHRRLDFQYDLKELTATAKAMSSAGYFLINILSALDNMFRAYMKLEEYRLDVE